jgi:hypothetical protein
MSEFLHAYRFRITLIVSLSLAFLLALGAVQTARAFEVRYEVIEADEVIDDDVYIEGSDVEVNGTVNGVLVVSAGHAEINGTVNGDLVVFAAEAEIEGTVAGNFFFGGQRLELNGPVEGTVFAAGSSIELGPEATVERNLVVGGFSLQMEEGTAVGRDVYVGGYQALLDGRVDRDVVASTAAVEIDGSIGGNVTATVAEPEPEPPLIIQIVLERTQVANTSTKIAPAGLQVGKGAEIAGTLTYKSSVEQADAIQSSAVGEVVYEYVPSSEESELTPAMRIKHWFVGQLQALITLVVLGALIAWRAPTFLTQPAGQIRAKPLPATLWGLLVALLVIPVGLLVLGVLTVLGILLIVVTLGELTPTIILGGSSTIVLAGTLFSLFISYGARLIVSCLIGKLLLGWLAPQLAERTIWPLMLGTVLYVIVTSIPCIGVMIHILAACASLGAVWLLIQQRNSTPEEAAAEEIPVEETPKAPIEE